MPPIDTNTPTNGDLSHIPIDMHHMAVPVHSLKLDPMNARLHPVNNLEGIKQSLRESGQCKNIVINKRTNEVIAGNGTLQAAISLGWKWIAVIFQDWTEEQVAAYALADNTTSDAAEWDMENKARLVRIIEAGGGKPACVSDDEVMAMRMLTFVPPPVSEDEGEMDTSTEDGPFLSEKNKEVMAEAMLVDRAVEMCRKLEGNDTLSKSQAIYIISYHYLNCRENKEHHNAGS